MFEKESEAQGSDARNDALSSWTFGDVNPLKCCIYFATRYIFKGLLYPGGKNGCR